MSSRTAPAPAVAPAPPAPPVPSVTAATARAGVLVDVDDPTLLETVHRLAAAAGVAVAAVGDRDGAPGTATGLVLVDPGALERGSSVVSVRPAAGGPVPPALHVVAQAPVADGTYRRALEAGAASVLVLPDDAGRLSTLLADLDRPREGVVLAVVGGRGGVGSTLLAAALARRAADRGAAVLVDLDPLGPGAGRVLGERERPGVTWLDLVGLDGRLAAAELRSALATHDGVGVLGWPEERPGEVAAALRPDVVGEVVGSAARGHEHVVLDLPRTVLAGQGARPPACDLLVLLVDATVPGAAAAARTLSVLRSAGAPVGLAVRRRRGGLPPDDVGRVLGAPLVTEVGHDRRVREQVDLGLGPIHRRRSPLALAADEVLAAVEPVLAARGAGARWRP